MVAAKRLLGKALNGLKDWDTYLHNAIRPTTAS